MEGSRRDMLGVHEGRHSFWAIPGLLGKAGGEIRGLKVQKNFLSLLVLFSREGEVKDVQTPGTEKKKEISA